MQRVQSVHPHQASNPMFAACLPVLPQVEKHPGGAINSVAGGKRRTYQAKQPRIFLSSIGNRMFTPCVVAGSSNPKQTTHHLDTELVPMRIDEFVGLPGLAGDPTSPRALIQRSKPPLAKLDATTTTPTQPLPISCPLEFRTPTLVIIALRLATKKSYQ